MLAVLLLIIFNRFVRRWICRAIASIRGEAGALAFVVDNASTRFDLALDESCDGTIIGQ